jgi:hypothetical protein
MTGTAGVVTGYRRGRMSRAGERQVVQWTVQALIPWALTVVHPSVVGLAVASAQLVLGGSFLLVSGAGPRLLARGAALGAVVGSGVDLSDLLGHAVQLVGAGLESALLLAVIAILRTRRARPVLVHRG